MTQVIYNPPTSKSLPVGKGDFFISSDNVLMMLARFDHESGLKLITIGNPPGKFYGNGNRVFDNAFDGNFLDELNAYVQSETGRFTLKPVKKVTMTLEM